MGHGCKGQTLLYQFLGTYLIPCHEVLHVVQHLHGGLLDPDPRSYAMEHDASRLNFVLLWHVMQQPGSAPGWAKWALMLEGVNRALVCSRRLGLGFDAAQREAYRRWADSFGLESPAQEFARRGDEAALELEGLAKVVVAGEGLAVAGAPPPAPHLRALLRAAFDPARRGDVYSDGNRGRLLSALPPGQAAPGEGALGRLLLPAGLARAPEGPAGAPGAQA